MERFSKKMMQNLLVKQIEYLEKKYRFTRQNGWNQVEGKGEEHNRAYGRWDTLRNLLDQIS